MLQASGLLELRLSVVRSPLSAMFLSLHWLLHFSPPYVRRERLAMAGRADVSGREMRTAKSLANSNISRHPPSRDLHRTRLGTGGSDEREAEARERELVP